MSVPYAISGSITCPYKKHSALLETNNDGLNALGGIDVCKTGDEIVFHAISGDVFNDIRYIYTAILEPPDTNLMIVKSAISPDGVVSNKSITPN